MELVRKRRGTFISQDYPAPNRVQMNFEIPLVELIVNFFDELKSRTKGDASMDYQFDDYRAGNLVKLEVLVGGEPVDALASIVHKEDAYHKGQQQGMFFMFFATCELVSTLATMTQLLLSPL